MLMVEYLFFFVESWIVDKIFPACPVGRGREGRDVRVLEEMTNQGKSLNPPFRNPKTSLLRRLQTQTLPDEAGPIDKINAFSKIVVTFEPVM